MGFLLRLLLSVQRTGRTRWTRRCGEPVASTKRSHSAFQTGQPGTVQYKFRIRIPLFFLMRMGIRIQLFTFRQRDRSRHPRPDSQVPYKVHFIGTRVETKIFAKIMDRTAVLRGSGMFILDPNFFSSRIPNPGSKRSRIQGQKDPGSGSESKNLSIFNPNNFFWALGNMIRDVHPGSGSWFFTHPVSRIWNTAVQYWCCLPILARQDPPAPGQAMREARHHVLVLYSTDWRTVLVRPDLGAVRYLVNSVYPLTWVYRNFFVSTLIKPIPAKLEVSKIFVYLKN